jgi:excisionase family DNA binding protein
MEERNELYDMTDLCLYLRISRPTATKILKSEELKGKKVGNCWRITQEAIDKYLGKE